MTWAGGSSWQLEPSSQHATLWLLLICCHRGTPFMFEKYLPPSTHSSRFLGFCRRKYWKNICRPPHSLHVSLDFVQESNEIWYLAFFTFFTFLWIFVQESIKLWYLAFFTFFTFLWIFVQENEENIWPSSHSLRFFGFLYKKVLKEYLALFAFFTFLWIFVEEIIRKYLLPSTHFSCLLGFCTKEKKFEWKSSYQ